MPLADGAVTLDIAAGVATDAAGNSNTAAARSTWSMTGRHAIPTLASSTNKPDQCLAAAGDGHVQRTGDRLRPDLRGGGQTARAGNLVGSGSRVYVSDVIPAADGTLTVEIAAGAATDAAGNISTIAEPLAPYLRRHATPRSFPPVCTRFTPGSARISSMCASVRRCITLMATSIWRHHLIPPTTCWLVPATMERLKTASCADWRGRQRRSVPGW